jgi:DNA invertase Pin-like site-specific DNA recombinase
VAPRKRRNSTDRRARGGVLPSGGKLIFHIFGALAEFERNLIRERTTAGLMAARARGRKGGRPKALTGKQRSIALDLYEKRHPIAEICRTLKISRATLYRYIKTGKETNNLVLLVVSSCSAYQVIKKIPSSYLDEGNLCVTYHVATLD